ncbi:hypothetical protein [Sphingomonas sp. PP-CC-3A-396]|nr:hypothetical protein [Sphingomonas sp. PP-CC-3A-396]
MNKVEQLAERLLRLNLVVLDELGYLSDKTGKRDRTAPHSR